LNIQALKSSHLTAIFLLTCVLLGFWPTHSGTAHSLPLGDGHVTDHPSAGNVYACQTTFRVGARHEGPWFHGDTWNAEEKPHVTGRVIWPEANFTLIRRGDDLAVEGNGLPVEQPTGIFPISPNDPAYQYDTNPNGIKAQNLSFEILAAPVRADQPGCLPMGMIGFTMTGVAIYNALDDAGRDAAAHEIQDRCDGHPQGKGQYHYHSASSPCLPGAERDTLVGWALDGYPILGMRDAYGTLLTNADLDACHGRAQRVNVSGRTYNYAYRLTREYPYTLGCFAGKVQQKTMQAIRRAMGPPKRRGPNRRPAPER
jgi:YHYH protein